MGTVAAELQNRIVVVLARARNPLNIGAAARAMGNFGFSDLRLVNEYDVPFHDARSAVDAAPVLQAARQFSSVAEAVADCTLVVGTTAMGERRLLHPVDVLRDGARHMLQGAAEGGRVALLFGSEKSGLSAEEMSHCHRLLTIPMRSSSVSMNLGQAVAVCLYELVRHQAPSPRPLPDTAVPAAAEQVARFEALLHEALVAVDYDRRFPGNLQPEAFHRLVRRLQLPAADVDVWLGMLRQVIWKSKQG